MPDTPAASDAEAPAHNVRPVGCELNPIWSAGQAQLPPVHTRPLSQTTPHAPQLLLSVRAFVAPTQLLDSAVVHCQAPVLQYPQLPLVGSGRGSHPPHALAPGPVQLRASVPLQLNEPQALQLSPGVAGRVEQPPHALVPGSEQVTAATPLQT